MRFETAENVLIIIKIMLMIRNRQTTNRSFCWGSVPNYRSCHQR